MSKTQKEKEMFSNGTLKEMALRNQRQINVNIIIIIIKIQPFT